MDCLTIAKDLMQGRYEGKVVLVSGAAAGIGRATADAFAREGATLVFNDVDEMAGRAFERELHAAGLDAAFVHADATREQDVKALVEGIVDHHGRLDIAVNNVGGMAGGNHSGMALHETSLDAWKGGLALNLTSTFLAMKYEIQQMLRQGGGVIANTASMSGLRYTPHGAPAYDAGKAAVLHLSRTAAVRYAGEDIRIYAVAPGLTLTPLIESGFTPEQRDAIAREFHPSGRMVTPQEVAETFLWVCSDAASGVTGLTIPVDGGWAAG